jgi:hypothetical protein
MTAPSSIAARSLHEHRARPRPDPAVPAPAARPATTCGCSPRDRAPASGAGLRRPEGTYLAWLDCTGLGLGLGRDETTPTVLAQALQRMGDAILAKAA